MHKVITFLGIRPLPASYVWNDKVYTGEVFAKALCQFWEFDSMLVLTTEGARTSTWPLVEALGDPRIQSVPIPDGHSTDEMWEIFDRVIGLVDEGDTVTFDITHAFRSLPFLTFLFAAYLKTARKVNIKAILYGALEMGSGTVLDLSSFVSMLDWITATDQFVQTGDARALSGLLEKHADGREASTHAANTLRMVSRAAFLCQPFTLMKEASKLEPALQGAANDFSGTSRPFSVLSDQINQSFAGFSQAGERDDQKTLVIEYQLIQWYFNNHQLIQALSLAREWMIDLVAHKLGRPLDFHGSERHVVEFAMSGIVRLGRKEKDLQTGEPYIFTAERLNQVGLTIHNEWSSEDQVLLKKIWRVLPEMRNRLGHAEHQYQPMDLAKNLKQAEEIRENLEKAAQRWGVI